MNRPLEYRRCGACASRYAVINLGVNLGLAVLKATIGLLAGSRALLAGAFYSVNDVLSGLVILICTRVARRPADDDHAYGHDKAEFIAIGLVSVIMAIGVVYWFFASMHSFLDGRRGPPLLIAALVAAFALVTNWLLAEYGHCVARRVGSLAVETCAEHNRSDAISSGAVIIGVAGAMLGLHLLDPLVAIFETVDVLRLSGKLLIRSVKGLMDTAFSKGEIEHIGLAASRVDGVRRVEEIRSRVAGARSFVDVVVALDPALSVEAATKITREVRSAVHQSLRRALEVHVAFKAGADVTSCVQPTPEPFAGGLNA